MRSFDRTDAKSEMRLHLAADLATPTSPRRRCWPARGAYSSTATTPCAAESIHGVFSRVIPAVDRVPLDQLPTYCPSTSSRLGTGPAASLC